ncbi:fibroblast growth factor receptor substrate 3 [Nothoprocta perdicaria]|uniref:fibroblast growth factor receptor substrate 3 n=1 Tax=Nothoprocta perdicaria TaxID=30464 RepID=UPI000E1BE661|nr:fibroblast growth factor receptor substrate 3 [Nothoprocta perdicaria]
MGSCCSCLCRDSIPDNHPTKFKVTNVDDEGTELGSGVMELTQTELILHTHKRDAVRWPYLCLRRYGYDSNLFSFESGRRCQTGQGIFAFKCSRAEEIFNLLQDLMQCNSINVVEEPVVITRNSHPAERELSRTPQASNSLGYTVPGLPNGFHSFPGETLSYSTARPPSVSSLRHSSVGEDSTHALIGPDEQSHTYVNTARGEQELRGRHCMHSLPQVHPPFPHRNHSCSLEDRDPQVFLQPGEVKFVLGPAPRHVVKRDSACQHRRECRTHLCSPNNNNNEWEDECPSPQCVYENVNGSVPAGHAALHRGGRLKPPREPRQLNYIQVELQAEAPAAAPAAARPADSYAVIDLKKTAAMSSLQRALPRDDGTARKTRHNSTDLPL